MNRDSLTRTSALTLLFGSCFSSSSLTAALSLDYTQLKKETLTVSNEEVDRRIAFITEHQAQFASDIQQLREAQAQTDQVVAQTGEIVARLANATLEGFKEVNSKIALVDSQIRTDQNLSRTDENLRNLIAVVDRYFSDGRNGR